MTENVTTNDFTMDPNLLVSVMKSQAGTLSKALLEGVMNSIDAGSKAVHLTLDTTSFTVCDSGRGFKTAEEIKAWFGRFGTPHTEGDAIYGRFRMGRGQMMAFAKTAWLSGPFVMEVDLEGKGLTYELTVGSANPVEGCEVRGHLYQTLDQYALRETLAELKKFVAYTPVPVYVNGELYGNSPARLKTWTYETDDAYIKLMQEKDELDVYNQGVFVESRGNWQNGMGGIIVSKGPLQVNFARNALMESKCSRWLRIVAGLEHQVFNKLATAAKLSNNERRYLACRVARTIGAPGQALLNAKVLTDPSGKHLPLKALKDYRKFIYVAERGSLACALASLPETFVVTDELLTRFRQSNIEEWFRSLKEHGHYLHADAVIEESIDAGTGLLEARTVDKSTLSVKQAAALRALMVMNERIGAGMVSLGMSASVRELLVGKSKGNKHIAWTDGRAFITVNVKSLKAFELGLNGVFDWAMTLIHEYVHDTDDSESHDHGEVFYQKFHEAGFSTQTLNTGMVVQAGLVEYLKALTRAGAPRPHELTRQLKPDLR